ncbi:hypothetical protein ACFSTI_25165 [Rhizorhabdus histidinilytica]|uniref:Uncharacterized protein n=1 Tax=Rhizorhabdus histidinilytica TaxID=439228 RepID=A0A1T5A762_9SPHN|nr:hypothetical protein [Rhizorhabdus histidinilytica]SKB30824.1 hypothetical protein SAMN06295920_101666 [Rhizorhabdus histidinilytica]
MASQPPTKPINITPPRVAFIDERTGAVSRPWYDFLQQQWRNGNSVVGAVVLTADDQTQAFPNSIALVPVTGELERLLDPDSFTLGLADAGTPGTYGSASDTIQITVDDKGRVTATQVFQLNTDNIVEGITNLYFTVARARAAISGAVGRINYDSTTGVIDLQGAIVTPGTYSNPDVTTDEYGRVTAITDNPGFTGSGAYTNFTFVNGICTSAS